MKKLPRRYTEEEKSGLISSCIAAYGGEPFPSWAGACRLQGVEPGTVMGWVKGDEGAYAEYLKARGRNEAHWVSLGSNNYRAQVFSIFALKTLHGDSYTDRVGVDLREWEVSGKDEKGGKKKLGRF